MTMKNCLRCDWQGETQEPTCPNCGEQPLYMVAASSSKAPGKRVEKDLEEPRAGSVGALDEAPSDVMPARPDPPLSRADVVEPSSRSARSVVAFVVTALVLTVALGTWLNAQGEPSAPAASTGVAVDGSPAADVSSSPAPAGVDAIEPDSRTLSRTVGGVDLSLKVPRSGWTNGPIVHPRDGDFFARNFAITKDTGGFQPAEAVVFWTSFPEGEHVDLCTDVLSPTVGPSAGDLATAMVRAPGTEVISVPSFVNLGGHEAEQMVFTVRHDRGCDPGYFLSWRSKCWGPCWTQTNVGDTIRVWIVEVGGTRIVVEAETAERAGPTLEQEIPRIVGSMRIADRRR